MPTIHQLFRETLPDIYCSDEVQDLEVYGKDWTKFYVPRPSLIAFPKTTAEVQKIVLFANQHRIGIVPSGGRTGLSGGATALHGEIVVSLQKMNAIKEFNPINQTITAEAGVITADIQRYAKDRNLCYPVDFAARGSSQIGGNIATNAGGIKVLKYGLTRHWVQGLTFVTGAGNILQLNKGLLKNATGYDLRHLAIGSEGTLGIVTEAILQLTPPPKSLEVFFLAAPNVDNILEILQIARPLLDLHAFEFLSDNCLKYHGGKAPFSEKSPFYVLLEFEPPEMQALEMKERFIEHLYEKNLITNDVFASDAATRKKIWMYREGISESISPYTPYKNDISVLPSDIPRFMCDAQMILTQHYPQFEVLWYGHIADGNLHINILKPIDISIERFRENCDKVSVILFDLVAKYGGSISAEHGVGLLKKDFLHYTRSHAEIEYLRGIKQVFDPNGIMNPGKLVVMTHS